MPKDESCQNCGFWTAPTEGEQFGICRRYPAETVAFFTFFFEKRTEGQSPGFASEEVQQTVYRQSPASEWCGEWRPNVEAVLSKPRIH